MRNLLLVFLLVTPQAPPVQPNPQAVQPLVGTLVIEAPASPEPNMYGDTVEAGWLFINGELRGKLPLSKRMMLAPGSYDVRIVIAGWSRGQAAYWTVRWPRVVVILGATHNLNPAGAVRMAIARNPFVGARQGPTPMDPGVESFVSAVEERVTFLTAEPRTLERFGPRADQEFDRLWENFRTAGAFAKVEAVARQLEEKPPSRPVVWIEIDDWHGGAREFDVEQLQFLKKVLRPDIGEWINRIVQYEPSLTKEQRDWVAARVKSLQARGEEARKYVDYTVDRIIAALQKASSR